MHQRHSKRRRERKCRDAAQNASGCRRCPRWSRRTGRTLARSRWRPVGQYHDQHRPPRHGRATTAPGQRRRQIVTGRTASNVGHSTNRAITRRCRRPASTADPITLPGVCEIFVTDTDARNLGQADASNGRSPARASTTPARYSGCRRAHPLAAASTAAAVSVCRTMLKGARAGRTGRRRRPARSEEPHAA